MKKVAHTVARVIVPRSIAGGLLRVAIIVVLGGLVGGGLAWKSSVDHAKKNSSFILARATKTVDQARKAYVDGAADKVQFNEALTSLREANASFNKGSYFSRSSYKQAESYATESITAAKTIIVWRKGVETAKSDATDAVDAAKTALVDATPAAATGLQWEHAQIVAAKTALASATTSFSEASYSNADAYAQAKSFASDSAAASQAVTTRVDNRLALVESKKAFKPYFDFYKRYPKTSQGKEALGKTTALLNDRMETTASAGAASVRNLVTIASFESQYPGGLPASVKKLAREQLVYEAQKQLTDMWPSVGWCNTFVNELLGQAGETGTSCGSADYREKGVTRQLETVQNLLPKLRQPGSMSTTYSSLQNASSELASMDAIMKVHGSTHLGTGPIRHLRCILFAPITQVSPRTCGAQSRA